MQDAWAPPRLQSSEPPKQLPGGLVPARSAEPRSAELSVLSSVPEQEETRVWSVWSDAGVEIFQLFFQGAGLGVGFQVRQLWQSSASSTSLGLLTNLRSNR